MSTTDPAGEMAAAGSELPNGVFGSDPGDPSSGQGDRTPEAEIQREGEPDIEDGVPSGDDQELDDQQGDDPELGAHA